MSRKTLISTFATRAFVVVALATTALTPLSLVRAAEPAFQVRTIDTAKGVDFAHNHSDIPPDPAVRFGKLPNGMTYVIMKNATPPGTGSLRLRFNAGSMMESDKQLGLAHFLEHMAFNGSKNVPEGEMIKILQRHGLEFGPDTNAYTNFDETVYQLDLPKAAAEDIDTGLFLLREAAGNLLIETKAVDDERGVILGEERARATPAMNNYKKWSSTTFPGQKYADRFPIGTPEIIKTAPRESFVDYYNAFYRPEQATLVAVGDFDVDAVEARIKAKFSDWTPAVPGAIRLTDFGAYKPKGVVTVDTYSEPGLRDGMTMTWAKPTRETYQTWGSASDDFIDMVRTAILNERFERQAKLPQTAFAAAGVGHDDMKYTAEVTQLSVTPKPGQAEAAFEQAYSLLRQFELYGASQPELDRVLANFDAGFKSAMQGAATRNTRDLADAIAGSIHEGQVFTSPQQDYGFFLGLKPKITLALVNAGVAPLFAGDGPVIWRSAETLGDFDKAAITASYEKVKAAQFQAAAADATKPWPYTDFGTPAAIVKREEIADLGIVQLTYANGVKATLKSTKFKEDEIGISIRFAGGLDSLSPAARPPVFQASAHGLSEGGLGQLTATEIKDSLNGRIYGIDFDIGEDSTTLRGGTTREDFALQMQVLMAFTTDSAYRADAWERLKAFVPNYYTSLASTPGGVFQMNADRVLHSNDSRFGIPSQTDFLATTNDQIRALIDTQLKSQPVEITIVGDVTEDQAKAQIAATFATLKPRTALPEPTDSDTVKFPATGLNQVFQHGGREDQGLTYFAFPTGDFFADTKRARGLEVLADVLSLRLTDEVREKQALAYSPNASSFASNAFTGYGYVSIAAEVKPEDSQPFAEALKTIVTDIKANPIGEDELLRARKPVLDRLENQWKTNGYWSQVLPGTMSDPRRLEAIRSRRNQLMTTSAADLQKLAVTYLDLSKMLTIQVKPAAKAQ
ncbi:pitrilysin family protein [Asticcacaulis sp. AC402]|uniref:M16 family metallopeptidase n=1 Tax=Asticcacaulis sp. AC402 TaxID=1282361 RepID=UPI0003C3EAD7|nr:insulinase family protein [Asticcacaulis sp. AC402]ESQ73833.1 peptidase M16 [Asticcacaulis sp. AC402]